MHQPIPRLLGTKSGRRTFLRHGTASLITGSVLLEACKKSDKDLQPSPNPKDTVVIHDTIHDTTHADTTHHEQPVPTEVTFTNDDAGLLNYAYALEQLEADFYSKVVSNAAFSSIFSMVEQNRLRDIAAHEKAHRDWFMRTIPDSARIPALTTKYGVLNFGDRAQVLATAKAFEDLGVSAYNGAGVYFSNVDYLLLASKIVSVEARHAAYIRELLGGNYGGSDVTQVEYSRMPTVLKSPIYSATNTPLTESELGFATTTNNGFDKPHRPSEVVLIAQAYITQTIHCLLP